MGVSCRMWFAEAMCRKTVGDCGRAKVPSKGDWNVPLHTPYFIHHLNVFVLGLVLIIPSSQWRGLSVILARIFGNHQIFLETCARLRCEGLRSMHWVACVLNSTRTSLVSLNMPTTVATILHFSALVIVIEYWWRMHRLPSFRRSLMYLTYLDGVVWAFPTVKLLGVSSQNTEEKMEGIHAMSKLVTSLSYTDHTIQNCDYIDPLLPQFTIDNKTEFGEVQFYFLLDDANQNTIPYALISVYGSPCPQILEETCNCVRACSYQGDSNLRIIMISLIASVISMQPLPSCDDTEKNLWFVVEKSGIDDTEITGYIDSISQDEGRAEKDWLKLINRNKLLDIQSPRNILSYPPFSFTMSNNGHNQFIFPLFAMIGHSNQPWSPPSSFPSDHSNILGLSPTVSKSHWKCSSSCETDNCRIFWILQWMQRESLVLMIT